MTFHPKTTQLIDWDSLVEYRDPPRSTTNDPWETDSTSLPLDFTTLTCKVWIDTPTVTALTLHGGGYTNGYAVVGGKHFAGAKHPLGERIPHVELLLLAGVLAFACEQQAETIATLRGDLSQVEENLSNLQACFDERVADQVLASCHSQE